jgi:hypothetical protein
MDTTDVDDLRDHFKEIIEIDKGVFYIVGILGSLI